MTREQHLYLKLIEECSEVQQITAKLMQFGPNEKWDGSNRERLQEEIHHLLAVIHLLDFTRPTFSEIVARREKIKKYLAYSISLGQVDE